ncbi:hypothetical protein HID58_057957 [Brassica napus]|uniref:Uncharacterized protein n=1 Tax=Brassica napus TaxID=3708 RepID=A0ABQ7ZNX1_BRANA|nr:hypothetical protein HID58_057957 [Brassica napus]
MIFWSSVRSLKSPQVTSQDSCMGGQPQSTSSASRVLSAKRLWRSFRCCMTSGKVVMQTTRDRHRRRITGSGSREIDAFKEFRDRA